MIDSQLASFRLFQSFPKCHYIHTRVSSTHGIFQWRSLGKQTLVASIYIRYAHPHPPRVRTFFLPSVIAMTVFGTFHIDLLLLLGDFRLRLWYLNYDLMTVLASTAPSTVGLFEHEQSLSTHSLLSIMNMAIFDMSFLLNASPSTCPFIQLLCSL